MSTEYTLVGCAAAPGIAIGPALLYDSRFTNPGEHNTAGPVCARTTSTVEPDLTTEVQRLDTAMAIAERALALAEGRLRASGNLREARMFSGQRTILQDAALREHAVRLMREQGRCACEAIVEAGEARAALVDAGRANQAFEIRDVVRQVWRILANDPSLAMDARQPVIVVAHDLGPFELTSIPRANLLGLALVFGGLTGHATILARAMGIPAVVGLEPSALDHLEDGTPLVLDGNTGHVVVAPTPDTLTRFRAHIAARAVHQAELRNQRDLASVTQDGTAIPLLANASSPAEARVAREWGAMGIGSLRTEILFLERPILPDEDEQLALYTAVAAELPDRPIVARTLDLGGDKYLPAFPLPTESNPFLGWRGIRIGLSHPDELLLPQLRAMLRVGAIADMRIVVPMITTLSEFRRVRTLLQQAHGQLTTAGIPCAAHPQLGVLIEVPAAALMADELAREADFISIGTNDLVQYTLACDRTSQRVADLYQPLEPAVLRLISHVIAAAHRHGRRVSMCGEMASDPALTTLLLGLGIDELSCTPAALPAVRAAIRATDIAAAHHLVHTVLEASTLDEVRALVFADTPSPQAT